MTRKPAGYVAGERLLTAAGWGSGGEASSGGKFGEPEEDGCSIPYGFRL